MQQILYFAELYCWLSLFHSDCLLTEIKNLNELYQKYRNEDMNKLLIVNNVSHFLKQKRPRRSGVVLCISHKKLFTLQVLLIAQAIQQAYVLFCIFNW